MLQVQSPQLERVANDAMNKLKSTWRKSIELCVFARVYAMNKASSCGEALHIDRQVSVPLCSHQAAQKLCIYP